MNRQNIKSINEAVARLSPIVKTSQFAWFIGHLLILFGSFIYVSSFFNLTFGYYTAYFGALISYGLVVYMSHPFSFSLDYLAKVNSNDNFLYLIVAFNWFTQKNLSISLLPYVLFSFFHFTGYLRSNILPVLFPTINQEAENQSQSPSIPAKLAFTLDYLKSQYYFQAIKIASLAEVSIIPLFIIINVLLRNTTFSTLFVYGFFLKRRSISSPQTRTAIVELEKILDGYILGPQIPDSVKGAYTKAKQFLASLNSPTPAPVRTADNSQ